MNFSKKNDIEHKFENIREHMFFTEMLERNSKNILSKTTHNKTIQNNIKQNLKNENNKNENNEKFICKVQDKLFWSFYIGLNGLQSFFSASQHLFKEEKDFKFKSIELMREKKSQLKAAKIKLSEVENELANLSKISIKSLCALCLLYEKNLIYIIENSYYYFNYGGDNEFILFEQTDKGCAIILLNKEEKIKDAKLNKLYLDINKTIKAISAYTIVELRDIANKLKISVTNETGKMLIKKLLYEKIVIRIEKLQQIV